MAKIRHIAIFSENPRKLAEFYVDVFGMKVTGVDDLGNAWITDGYMDVALIARRSEKAPKAGINHWGFTIEPGDKADIYAKMKKYGVTPYSPYVDSPEAHRPYAEDAVRLRRWDDTAKIVGLATPTLDHFATYVRQAAGGKTST